jgi:hypothetical protein
MDEELESFKRIRLYDYAAEHGYELDRDESSKRELVMRKANDKIAIRLDTDGHYVYYSFRDQADNGTIIDFIKRRQGKSLGEVRKTLRSFQGRPATAIHDPLEVAPRFDRDAVVRECRSMQRLRWHGWLEAERKIPRSVLLALRFEGCLLVDARANAIFPHHDEFGVCGFEKRNRNFKGFAPLGKKGLWMSAKLLSDRCLVVGESAIDCLSYEALFPGNRYASLAGGLNPDQPALIAAACRDMPAVDSQVICITHGDAEGERYAEAIRQCSPLPVRIHRPENVKDWNDVLRATDLHSFPAARW